MGEKLHIISFDVPFPPHYGGIIDVWAKIRALHQAGVHIILHCFLYRDRREAPDLEAICKEVHYYPRPLKFRLQFSQLPFVVRTRKTDPLIERLIQDTHPIFFEGLHTCGFINHPDLSGRRKLVRMHNVEWQYYRRLAQLETHWLKKGYLLLESARLRAFEPMVLRQADVLLPISVGDEQYFRSMTSITPIHYLPAFHGYGPVHILPGKGAYSLFHGNLSIRDNERAAVFLIEQVFGPSGLPFRVAGLSPGSRLKGLCEHYPHIQLVASPTEEEMERLIQEAHINILYSYQTDGMKIKLLRALHRGRFVLVNPGMVRGTGLEILCRVADGPDVIREAVQQLWGESLPGAEIEKRRQVLSRLYSDQVGANQILTLL